MGRHRRIADIQPFAELAQGATTVVYKGYQRSLERFVLLKVLRPGLSQDPERVRRFEAEAQLVAQIQHPNVVAIYACGQDDGQSYLAAEFVEGFDVASVLAHGPLPVELATFVLLDTARGLRAAHRQGVLHRDIKPANILVSHDGQVKLTDFGMASLAEGAAEAEVRGTWGYLAPEQVRGEAPTPAADLFSLGATAFEMLTARRPFTGQAAGARIDALLHHDPLPLLDRLADIPADLRALCARLLAKTPARRYPDAAALIADLEAVRQAHGYTAGAEALASYLHDPAAYRQEQAARVAEEAAVPVPAVPVPAVPVPAATAPVRLPVATPRRRRGLAVALVVVAAVILVVLLRPSPEAEGPQAPPATTTLAQVAATDSTPPPAGAAADTTARPTPPAVPEETAPPPDDAVPEAPPQEEVATPPGDQDEPVADRATPAADTMTAPAAGALTLQVSPWADVYVDAQLLGRTPLQEALTLAPGPHALVLEHPRFPAYRTTIDIRPGEAHHLATSLWDLVGTLTLEVSPWADVAVDGEPRDTTPLDRALILTPGRHRLTLSNPALGRWDTTLTITPGQARTLRVNLHQLLAQ